jgi:hypothetical protein
MRKVALRTWVRLALRVERSAAKEVDPLARRLVEASSAPPPRTIAWRRVNALGVCGASTIKHRPLIDKPIIPRRVRAVGARRRPGRCG